MKRRRPLEPFSVYQDRKGSIFLAINEVAGLGRRGLRWAVFSRKMGWRRLHDLSTGQLCEAWPVSSAELDREMAGFIDKPTPRDASPGKRRGAQDYGRSVYRVHAG